MARNNSEAPVVVQEPAAPRLVKVEFVKGYRPVEVPNTPEAADPCWKYVPGDVADLPLDEARRAVEHGIARRAFEDAL